jgi:hypothetical protein
LESCRCLFVRFQPPRLRQTPRRCGISRSNKDVESDPQPCPFTRGTGVAAILIQDVTRQARGHRQVETGMQAPEHPVAMPMNRRPAKVFCGCSLLAQGCSCGNTSVLLPALATIRSPQQLGGALSAETYSEHSDEFTHLGINVPALAGPARHELELLQECLLPQQPEPLGPSPCEENVMGSDSTLNVCVRGADVPLAKLGGLNPRSKEDKSARVKHKQQGECS